MKTITNTQNVLTSCETMWQDCCLSYVAKQNAMNTIVSD